MKIGFTGTQHGMTEEQRRIVGILLANAQTTEFHYGDCVGADEQAARIANNLGNIKIVCHPPIIKAKRAYAPAHEVLVAKEYWQRNHDIVDNTDKMIATPKEYKEVQRSGTWATIRYAKRQGKVITVVWPDGTLDVK